MTRGLSNLALSSLYTVHINVYSCNVYSFVDSVHKCALCKPVCAE